MHAVLRTIALIVVLAAGPAVAQNAPPPPPPGNFGPGELMETGHKFFGTVSRGLASIIEQAVSQWGLPNGYVLGQEAGGAFVAGLRYGEGTLYTKNAGDLRVFWQGPSVGCDFGGDGARTMMLVYSLPATDAIYQRFAGIDGSAYFIGGFGMTALDREQYRRGSDPLRRGTPPRRQYRLSQIHPDGDLEPVLTSRTSPIRRFLPRFDHECVPLSRGLG